MRVRKLTALLGATFIFGACFVLYMFIDIVTLPLSGDIRDENKWVHVEDDSVINQKVASDSKNAVHSVIHRSNSHSPTTSHQLQFSPIRFNQNALCGVQFQNTFNTDIQMLDLYDKLKFDNLDGGAWKQGWNIEYDANQWGKNNKLKVFVVPHSHNDPGWIKTFVDYYQTQTRSILNNMVMKLPEDSRRRFIWAEISYFSLWWDEIKPEIKAKVRDLLQNGQLEIVTGGWVMNDEANTHYYSMLEQMITGHNFLTSQLNYKPSNSWSIDPFGQSATMPFLLKKMGLENLVIQRVHYSVKKQLARSKQLEFRWRQMWDNSGTNDLLTHMMPFYSYDVPHTCGPDPKVCCQFDFRRLPGYGLTCPWKQPPQPITDNNVAHRAEMLVNQYKKKAQLYKTNVLLVPLGDDFRYDHASEWDNQFNNYQKLFDYMNTNPNLHVQAQFGTLKDFFSALREERQSEEFPTLSGDFFTYADRDDHYWSGYYTSRPFYKRMDRVLISYLRAAEILYALAWGSKKQSSEWFLAPESGLSKLLVEARQSLSLFQHHDGITGTAKDHVVEDYARMMHEAITSLQHIIQQSAHFLLLPPKIQYQHDSEFLYFDLDDVRKHHYSIGEKMTVSIGSGMEGRKVVLFNSLISRRQELVTIRVSAPYVKISHNNGTSIPCQISPVFLASGGMKDGHYDVSFVSDIAGLSLETYSIHGVTKSDAESSMTKLRFLNFVGNIDRSEGFEKIEMAEEGREFSLYNQHLAATFTRQGLLKAVTLKSSDFTLPLHLDFARYTARPGKERSGAYLFLPSGEAETVLIGFPVVRILEGMLYSEVNVVLPGVHHTVRIYNTSGIDSLGIDIYNLVDISEQSNYELVMRLSSNIKNGDEFFTDLNGYQMIRRRRFRKLPLQANYYPMPTMAYIEDEKMRLSLITAQPLGMGSLKEGEIEVMQDRRLNQDDNRGLGQGVLDNRVTPTIFRIFVEQRKRHCQDIPQAHPSGLPSMDAHLASLSLLNPLFRLVLIDSPYGPLENSVHPLGLEPGTDIHLVKLHTILEQPKVGIILHRLKGDSCFGKQHQLSTGAVQFSSLFPSQFGDNLTEYSLSFLHPVKSLSKEAPQFICPMDMSAYVLSR